nr:hypothetical protein CFP56_22511 [Quercus suber]
MVSNDQTFGVRHSMVVELREPASTISINGYLPHPPFLLNIHLPRPLDYAKSLISALALRPTSSNTLVAHLQAFNSPLNFTFSSLIRKEFEADSPALIYAVPCYHMWSKRFRSLCTSSSTLLSSSHDILIVTSMYGRGFMLTDMCSCPFYRNTS